MNEYECKVYWKNKWYATTYTDKRPLKKDAIKELHFDFEVKPKDVRLKIKYIGGRCG
jgi:hypothetical protein